MMCTVNLNYDSFYKPIYNVSQSETIFLYEKEFYVCYSEINIRWAVKKNKKEGKIFYYMQKLAT